MLAPLLTSASASSATRYVPAQYSTIQSAINASVNGDLILVSPGTYHESISYNGKNVTLRSTDGPDVTTISALGLGKRVVYFTSVSNAATLDGFTIRDGNPTGTPLTGHGGGILCCSSSSPTILNCIIRDNQAELGGGIYICLNSSGTRIGNTTVCNNLCFSGYGFDIAQGFVNLGNVVQCAECGCDPGDFVQWAEGAGGNGHWYQARLQTGWLSWDGAHDQAIAEGGSLASIESASEQSFVHGLLRPYSIAYWIGLIQDPAVGEPAGGWDWSDGTPLGFTAWGSGLPDNNTGDQHWGCMRLAGTWDDFDLSGETYSGRLALRGLVIEWSADCNGDGIVDFGQILDGSLSDSDADGIPDCCEEGTACFPGDFPMAWHEVQGGNGHWYGVTEEGLTWQEARDRAAALGGHLLTIESDAENTYVSSALVDWVSWIGGRQIPGSCEPDCGWEWITGEPFTFTAWQKGEPSETNNEGENFLEIYRPGTWNDNAPIDFRRGIIEWEADCNGDGLVDFGQIQDGSLADSDGNGVPDICQHDVPTEFSTIQAAIDAVPAGAHRLVQVAAGNYNESFDLKGKDVVVRGAPNGATTLDGTGLTSSIAIMKTNEPRTAGIESIAFINGTSGQPDLPPAQTRRGGGVFAAHTSGFVRNCSFTACGGVNFGAGLYAYEADLLIEDCDFHGNNALDEGGGALIFRSNAVVRNCSFTQNTASLTGTQSGSAFKSVGARTADGLVLLEDCTITGNSANQGCAVEHFENQNSVPGTMRLVDTIINGNTCSNQVTVGGLRLLGRAPFLVVGPGTVICANSGGNAEGAYLIEGDALVCDCLPDLTGDGEVSGGDLGIVLSKWGPANEYLDGDVNHDGQVDGVDLTLVLNAWGTCP